MRRTLAIWLVIFCSLHARAASAIDFGAEVLISVHDQKMALMKNNQVVAEFRISTSRFGLGDELGSYKTPMGVLWVCNKIGDNLPLGAVIRHRFATGEVLAPNAPGRDPIVTRVIWLKGLSGDTQRAYDRCIYIHGTAEEKRLGKPVSWGCIRMSSRDVAQLYDAVSIGTHVTISDKKLAALLPSNSFADRLACGD